MAEKKSVFGTVLAIGAVAAVAAAAVAAYRRRDELRKLSEDIMDKVRPTDTEGVYTADVDGDGSPDFILADTDGDGRIDTILTDTDGDGRMDEVALDTDGDGHFETTAPILCDESDFEDDDDMPEAGV